MRTRTDTAGAPIPPRPDGGTIHEAAACARTTGRPVEIGLIVSLAALCLLSHPYTGIRHDALLYTA